MVGKLLLAAALVGGVWIAVAPAAPAPLHLPMPVETVSDRLRTGRRTVTGTGLGYLTLSYAGHEADALLIAVDRAGSPAQVRCRVCVTPDAAASEAFVDCAQPPTEERAVQLVGIRALEIVVIEHVSATATAHPYDIDAVSKAMMGLIVRNRATLAASAMRDR